MFSILSLFDWYQSPCPRAPPSGPRSLRTVASFIASYAPSAKAKVNNDDEESEALNFKIGSINDKKTTFKGPFV